MARFYFQSERAANEAYHALQDMALWVADMTNDYRASLASKLPPPPGILDTLCELPELLGSWEADTWQEIVNDPVDLSTHAHWNGFTRNVARFADTYRTLMMYDFADGRFDGQIDFGGRIQQFSFGNLESCDNGVNPSDASDVAQCRPANFWRIAPAQVGEASYYSMGFEERRTAAGTIYQTEEFSVAHRSLPLGTIVDICEQGNLNNCVTAIVTDRGPYAPDKQGRSRIVDLSPAIFKALSPSSTLTAGVMPVSLSVALFPEAEIFPAVL